jgi:hypothetical protein
MKDYSKLSDEELRIKAAKALRWTDVQPGRNGFGSFNGVPVGVPPWYKGKNPEYNRDPLPNFPGDLNACHEFEEALTVDQAWAYSRELDKLLGTAAGKGTGRIDEWAFHATARQRCIALLSVLKPE